jgi:hypothetical protein
MSTRVVLNAKAVRELISLEEGAVAELAKTATEQVAEALKRKLVNKNIADQIDKAMSHALVGDTKHYTPSPLIDRLINERVKRLFTDRRMVEQLSTELASKVVLVAENKIGALVEDKLKARIDALILSKLNAVLQLKS